MNLTVTLPDSSLPAWEHRLNTFNAGSGQPAITLPELVQLFVNDETARVESQLDAYQRALLAADEQLLELGKRVKAAPPEKQAAVFAAVEEALS